MGVTERGEVGQSHVVAQELLLASILITQAFPTAQETMSARPRSVLFPVTVLLTGFFVSLGNLSAQAFPESPTAEQAAEAVRLVNEMKNSDRGPFLRIRWFCNDGTVHAPGSGVCTQRGGGHQHAEHSLQSARLAELGFDVGTILQGMDYAAFADSARAGYRLRELVMERFLMDVDDGWVMRRARYYRGALQVEDEDRQGEAFLRRRVGTPGWTSANYLLAMRLAVAVPHARAGGATAVNRIRSLATEIADLDAGFMRTRIRIHSVPSRSDIGAVESYLAGGQHPAAVQSRLVELRDALRRQYDPTASLESLQAWERALAPDMAAAVGELRGVLQEGDARASLRSLAAVATQAREAAESSTEGARTLRLLDLQAELQERAFVMASELESTAPSTRADGLARVSTYLELAYAGGYLSARERDSALAELRAVATRQTMPVLEYKTSLSYIGRSLDWARGTVRGTFAPVMDRFALIEPRAMGLLDDVLRGSVLLPMSRTLDALQTDADLALGSAHHVLGGSVAGGVRGLNPGVAMRTLRVLHDAEHEVDARTIYVLPETPAELKPVAGVLTLDEGNLLSHVQLLARNLGIPNASMRPSMIDVLEQADGREVFYAVTPLGRVIVKWPDAMTEEERALLPSAQPAQTVRHRLDTSRLDLTRWQPIPLAELNSARSGIVVGPKAANLGQLNADFPGRVSAAVALPFGMFARHADRPWNGSENTVLEEVRQAYGRASAMRAEGRSDAEVNAMMVERLTWVRQAIEGLPWIPELRDELVRALETTLEGNVSRGVFVRSDTNVEDLPEFSGAGLNMTVAHQTSVDDVLSAVKRVWTSPFSERAYLWRSQILEEQGDVYPSVLLQESIASAKSGVLITSGLQEGGPDDMTVVTAEGVGGAVDGEDAETLVVHPDGSTRLISQAKSSRQRELTRGGTRWVASVRPDMLLQPDELAQLREVVRIWKAKLEGTPDADETWDMEWGFVDGRLWLFQVRPFVRFRNSDLQQRLEALDADVLMNGDRVIRIAGALEGS